MNAVSFVSIKFVRRFLQQNWKIIWYIIQAFFWITWNCFLAKIVHGDIVLNTYRKYILVRLYLVLTWLRVRSFLVCTGRSTLHGGPPHATYCFTCFTRYLRFFLRAPACGDGRTRTGSLRIYHWFITRYLVSPGRCCWEGPLARWLLALILKKMKYTCMYII